jgi:hypothetical protein
VICKDQQKPRHMSINDLDRTMPHGIQDAINVSRLLNLERLTGLQVMLRLLAPLWKRHHSSWCRHGVSLSIFRPRLRGKYTIPHRSIPTDDPMVHKTVVHVYILNAPADSIALIKRANLSPRLWLKNSMAITSSIFGMVTSYFSWFSLVY